MLNDLGQNLLRYQIDKSKFTVYDFETTGLNLFFDRPWSIGWLDCEGKNITKIHDQYLWWPDMHISKGAAAVTNFNYSEYKEKAEDPKKVYEEFHNYIYDHNRYKLGHNILSIDIQMLQSWRRNIGLPVDYSFLDEKTIDSNSLEKAIIKNIKPSTPRLEWYFKLSSLVEKGLKTNLGLCARKYGVNLDESMQHQAKYDIMLNWEIFKKQIYQIEI